MQQYGSEKILPYNKEEEKGAQVQRMFDNIAGAYDRLNHILSLGFDRGWRRKGIAFLKPFQPRQILDIATGTGDLAIALCRKLQPQQVVGADISEEMMRIGREKVEKAGLDGKIRFEQQDCLSLTYEENSFDAVTAAFGVRNFADIRQGLTEMHRVLSPGGQLMILELTTPEHFPMKQLFALYSHTVIPLLGRLFSRERKAYKYLPASIEVVPQGKVMINLLVEVGFKEVKLRRFTGGICTMYTGQK
ncbi:bifunctional demethylmenaquinone methyltransferase/2-methoxy-6-polyprenyl-1,4-benzoquinol methylase UbiE [Parabacteroides sp. OttesenSCG-928-G06]|nr:bifunctional demethylmenaquinone methyltransferase/2-methoxy-6-polyprenyl-1,4-benzoquinol methylase UbiE [Parabacteroides sp. OttesenSCG-928-K15]MDL2282181.1 bifunctional demethylmenaquinone methyltransferase/2-methoxy-6-polyprenyl-1,4-benzoquinol methylase UbiE [Parabacteroides sp. OttesenSCG-928-G06]